MKALKVLALCLAIVMVLGAAATAAAKAKPTKQPDGQVGAQWWGKAPGPKPAPKPFATGIVKNVSLTNIAIATKQGLRPFVVNEQTKVRVRGQKAKITDVKVGDVANVHFQLQANNVPLALGVAVPIPHFQGKISRIEGNTIFLKTEQIERRVLVTDKTRIGIKCYVGSMADLFPGMGIAVVGDIKDNVITASRIEFMPALAKGTVIAREGNVITVKTVKQLTIVVGAGAWTCVNVSPRIGPDKKGTLEDIKVGAPVNIAFHPGQNGPGKLLWIDILVGM